MNNLNKEEARLYDFVMEVIQEIMDNYGYDYVINDNDSNKYYTTDMESIRVFNKEKDELNTAELISLGFYLFKRLGLEDIEVSINKDDVICNLLDILEVEYLSNIDSTTLKWNYKLDNTIIATGTSNNFNIDISKLINLLMDYINKNALKRKIEVNIISNTLEEQYQGLRLAQNLRLNNINTLINSDTDGKFNILLNEEDLSKGIINIKDNLTNEIVKLDESDIVDYILANI